MSKECMCHLQDDCEAHNTCLYCNTWPCRCEMVLDQDVIDAAAKKVNWSETFEVTTWWDYGCHGSFWFGQYTDQYTREELAMLFKDLHLCQIKVGVQHYERAGQGWAMVELATYGDLRESPGTTCTVCLAMCEDRDPWEGWVNNEGDLNWEHNEDR